MLLINFLPHHYPLERAGVAPKYCIARYPIKDELSN